MSPNMCQLSPRAEQQARGSQAEGAPAAMGVGALSRGDPRDKSGDDEFLLRGMRSVALCRSSARLTSTIASRAGTSMAPRSVSSYSTEGGEVGRSRRRITPRASSSLSRVVSTLGETGGMSTFSSPKRRGPARRCQITCGVQAPAMIDRQGLSSQPSGGFGAWFFLTFSAIGVSLVTARKPDSPPVTWCARLQRKAASIGLRSRPASSEPSFRRPRR